MSCNKIVFAAASVVAASLAHAAVPTSATSGPVKPAVMAAPVAVPVAAPVAASAVVVVPTPVGSESHLMLGQINDAARAKVLKSLRDAAQSAPTPQVPAPAFGQVPAPAVNQIPQFPATLAPSAFPPAGDARREAVRPRVVTHDDGVSIVGTMVDGQSSRVLYSYNGGIYSAAVGQKMLNGAVAKAIHGFNVTVTNGKRSWDVPVAATSDMGSR